MYNDYENVPVGNLVIISTDVDEEINGRYYLRVDTPEHFSLKGDLSGAQGIQGPQGPQGIQGPQGPQGIQGPTGPIGNGISSIEKTATSGLVDTYTITYTNGNTTTFDVSNGNGIDRIEKTDTVGNIDTYTIYFTNGETTTYEVENGEVTKEELQEEVDRLNMVYNALPSTTGEAEEISIDGTAEVPFRKMDLKGNTYQYSTTGKNLLPNNATSTTSNGITWTVNEDGSITANGTTSSSTSVFQMNVGTLNLDSSKNYTIRLYNFNHIQGLYTVSGTTKYNFQNISNTSSISNPMLYVSSNTTVLNEVCYPMLVEGTYTKETIPSYEKYTGGIASPNPDYPQDIQVVSGDNTIKVEGKNLNYLQKLKLIVNQSGKVITNNSYWNAIIDTRNVNSIYISGNYSLLQDSVLRIGLFNDYPVLNSQCTRVTYSGNSSLDTTNCNYVLLCYGTADNHTIEEIQNSFMVSYGSSSVPFTPYVSQTYPINLGNIELCKIGDYQDKIAKSTGKNLFDNNSSNFNASWDGGNTNKLTLLDNGNIQTTADYGSWRAKAININNIQPNTTYTLSISLISATATTTNKGIIRIPYYDGTTVKYIAFDNSADVYYFTTIGTQTFTFTTPSDMTNIGLSLNTSGANTNAVFGNIQLELGSSSSSYEPYGKVWYLNKQIGKFVLDGSETWGINATNQFYISGPNLATLLNNNYLKPSQILMNYFGYYNRAFGKDNSGGIASSGALWIRFDSSYNLTDTTDLSTWLSTHNTIVYYPLATPTYTEITDTTLISQLEAIKSAYSYDTQTNISQTNEDKPFIISYEAILSLKNILNSLETRIAVLETE